MSTGCSQVVFRAAISVTRAGFFDMPMDKEFYRKRGESRSIWTGSRNILGVHVRPLRLAA